ncbi:VapE domain-containing protein [Thalassospira sp.]|uniref:VapE domain-containing protein n=1 Tax=Thalassospira sp. TaxID=1912094 RepID=UPI000C4B1201|nr:VapE domain-containing protein [Thalassospira sp.]MBA07049.1 hypothetical protein [Thalassospira sp.]HBS25225.1 hypothetical protein [Thalassospira sp.]|tara:strand:- start:944 stop:2329 length:1386 start_codon:yes stop_codon:yes gene_type:complete
MNFIDHLKMWEEFPAGHIATEELLADLLTAAQTSKNASPEMWEMMKRVLEEHAPFKGRNKKKDAENETQRCRSIADLGIYPRNVKELIIAFIESCNIEMNFNGSFTMRGEASEANYIQNEMELWSSDVKYFSERSIRAAFQNWQVDERKRRTKAAYKKIRYVPDSDPDQLELDKLIHLIVANAGDATETDRNRKAAKVAISNFIYRVKNHMRGKWKHGCHLMPVLYGSQGCGKTTVVQHLTSPIDEFISDVGFGMLNDNAQLHQVTVMPVMFFDEMAGIKSADVEALKGVMTANTKQIRQIYEAASVKTIVSTFIGCSNRDIRTLIRDETGNRRFLQIDMKLADRKDIYQIDMLKIWRSVDEDGQAPLFENKQQIEDVQEEQRCKSPIEEWLDTMPAFKDAKASVLFANQYSYWLNQNYPGDAKYMNVRKFGLELTRLVSESRVDNLTFTKKQGTNYYSIA